MFAYIKHYNTLIILLLPPTYYRKYGNTSLTTQERQVNCESDSLVNKILFLWNFPNVTANKKKIPTVS